MRYRRWRPAQEVKEKSADGIFGHLKPKLTGNLVIDSLQGYDMEVPANRVADRQNTHGIPSAKSGPFTALVTAVNPDAPPILQWDSDDAARTRYLGISGTAVLWRRNSASRVARVCGC